MWRKNVGGVSSLRPNRSSKAYNETLEHVYQTAIFNLDEKQTKGRTSLGGDGSLGANRLSKEYNETLEHVYQTAVFNVDKEPTKGRKNLDGDSSLGADHSSKEYNETLEHVLHTAVFNVDKKHAVERQNLGGDNSMGADDSSKEYNETLEHVLQTAVFNEKHTKRNRRRRFRIPNLLSLCFKSAKDDVIDDDFRVPPSRRNHESETDATVTVDFADNDTVFLMNDGGLGHGSHYRPRSGMTTSTAVFHAVQSVNGSAVASKSNSYTI